jgi:hypothetical protein
MLLPSEGAGRVSVLQLELKINQSTFQTPLICLSLRPINALKDPLLLAGCGTITVD